MKNLTLASRKEKWIGLLAMAGLFTATLCWGASFFLVKKATALVGIWPFLFWRFLLTMFVMVSVFPQKFFSPRKTQITQGFVLGALLFLTLWPQVMGLQSIAAGKSGFLTSLYVPFVPILGWIIFRQRLFSRQLIVAFIAVVGLYFLTGPQGREMIVDLHQWLYDLKGGDLWTLGAAVTAALHILYTERFTRTEPDSIGLGLWQFAGCFTFIVLAIFMESVHTTTTNSALNWNLAAWPSFAVASVIFNAIFSTCFAFIMQIICQKTLGALKSSLIFALEAPFSVLFAFLFTGEALTQKEFIGALIVFLVSIVPDGWLKGETNGPF